MAIKIPGPNPLKPKNDGLSPLEQQLVKRNVGGQTTPFPVGNLPSPMPKLPPPVLRDKHESRLKMKLQPKTRY